MKQETNQHTLLDFSARGEDAVIDLNCGYLLTDYSESAQRIIGEAMNTTKRLFNMSLASKLSLSSRLVNSYDSGWSIKGNDQSFERWHVDLECPEINWPQSLSRELDTIVYLMKLFRASAIETLDTAATVLGSAEKGELRQSLLSGQMRARLMYYRVSSKVERNPAHIDRGIATLFVAESTEGLLHLDLKGEWHKCNITRRGILGASETMAKIAGISPFQHKVIGSDVTRHSIALFLHGSQGRFATMS